MSHGPECGCDVWGWYDPVTNRPTSISSTLSKESAERTLQGWLERDARGGRPDLHHMISRVVVMRLDDMPVQFGEGPPLTPEQLGPYWKDRT